MNVKKLRLPTLIIVIGMILAVSSCFLTGMRWEPTVKEQDFRYSVTYTLDGEEKTFEGIFQCRFAGYEEIDDLTGRRYDGVYTSGGNVMDSLSFTVAVKEGVELYIVTDLDAAYLMGDPDEEDAGNRDPYLEAVDAEGIGVEVSDWFDAEIIGWEYPDPIENSFAFAGFSALYALSMLAMLAVAVLTLIATIILVKRDDGVCYRALDGVSTISNFAISLVAVPFLTVVIFFMPLVVSTQSLVYQIYLCLPALTVFAVVASVALRRKGFTRCGLIVQFIFPALFFAHVIVDSLIQNLFM